MRRYRLAGLACMLVLLASAGQLAAQDERPASLEGIFQQKIQPMLREHCLDCHAATSPEAGLDLSAFASLRDVVAGYRVWETILLRVEAGEMPPEDAGSELAPAERQALLKWIREMQTAEAERNAGDPGPVLARRLSNAEYDYSIRDLTGVDIRPTKTFPVDPANESGFDNSGESLNMSPALMSKYLSAAREVADHLVLVPSGIRFAPHPVVTPTDRDKYCVKRIVQFYQQQPTDYAGYFFAGWRFKQIQAGEDPKVTVEQVASKQGVSSKYLALVLNTLEEGAVASGPLLELQEMWRALLNEQNAEQAKTASQQMRDFVMEERKKFEPSIDNLEIEGVHKGSQPFVLWKNDQYAAHRRLASFDFLKTESQQAQAEPEETTKQPQDKNKKKKKSGDDEPNDVSEAVLSFSSDEEKQQYMADCQVFCFVFPDAFYISERGRDYLGKPRDEQEKGRLLSAGFHSMMGYYRDDQPLYELILDERAQQRLDQLWEELECFANVPVRQYQGFLWFDRTDSRFMRDPEFDFARPEDRASLTEPMIEQLAEVYLAKATRNGGTEVPLQAIRDFFQDINARIRWVERTQLESESRHLEAVIELAAQAFRRPLHSDEAQGLRDYYHELRTTDQLTHEEAIQDTLVSILLSPHFCYRVDLLSDSPRPRPLDDYELASRLSYFLWSSLPDQELLHLAAQGQLRDPQVLIQQTRRMLQDPRIRGLAMEFGGNWLGMRRFEEHNSVDRERFPSFNDELRAAMFEEPIRFFIDVVQRDASLLEFVFAEHTFVNKALAEHYGLEQLDFEDAEWQKVEQASSVGRGGLLPMSVFLTKNAPGLRTSPVKRGYWVVRNLLGEHIPAPPPNVPDLPEDEAALGELTLSEVLARHREHESCAGCHDRIDPLGLVFEEFGPIGERRTVDLGGKPVQTQSIFPDGSQRTGVSGLREYLQERREHDLVKNFHRKLLAFALGRSLQLSDEILLRELFAQAQDNDYRFGMLVESIVTSPQFLNKRGRQPAESLAQGETHGE